MDTRSTAAKTYIFDFNAEVARARAEYPAETKSFTFVDLADPNAEEQIWAWHATRAVENIYKDLDWRKASPGWEARHGVKLLAPEDLDPVAFIKALPQFAKLVDQMTKKTLASPALCTPAFNGYALIAIDTSKKVGLLQDSEKDCFLAFNHELGHALLPKDLLSLFTGNFFADLARLLPKYSKEKNMAEKKAETFAALRGLRQGIFDASDVRDLAIERLARVCDDAVHFTTDALLALPALDNIESLCPPAIKNIAAKHAERFPKTVEAVFEEAKASFENPDILPELLSCFERRIKEVRSQNPPPVPAL